MEPSVDNNPQPISPEQPTPNEPEPVAPSESAEPVTSTPAPTPAVSSEPNTPSAEATVTQPAPSQDIPAPEEPLAPEPTPEDPLVSDAPLEPSSPIVTEDNTAPDSTAEPAVAPKPKKSLIALVAALVLVVLAGGGCLAWFMLPHDSVPDNNGQSSGNSTNPDQPSNSTNPNYNLSTLSDFDLSFLRLENDGKNVVYSPLSIKYALAMLSAATAGESKTQIDNLIGNYQPNKYVNNEHRSFANAMFIRNTIKDNILTSYTDTLEQKFNASVVFDPFYNATPINDWVKDQTMGIIENILDNDDITEETDFALINALAIDMDWNNQLQCAYAEDKESRVPCKKYYVSFAHEKYSEVINYATSELLNEVIFNGSKAKAAKIGATANRYDIVKELGEEYIRSTVLDEFEKWKVENDAEDEDFDIDLYMQRLNENYGKYYNSTDFYFSDNENEKVFAKDLKEYNGSTLQYIGVMPKSTDLKTYVDSLAVNNLSNLISGVKDVSKIDNYKDGVITKITGYIPVFNFNYELSLKQDLEKLGITDVFDRDIADLSGLTSVEHSYIKDAFHKADIDFSNDGIKAAAATVLSGGLGAAASFDYRWDVPVEEIDITFDQPFFFVICDKATGEVWFTGTVYQAAQ